jgi:hypothetical protein
MATDGVFATMKDSGRPALVDAHALVRVFAPVEVAAGATRIDGDRHLVKDTLKSTPIFVRERGHIRVLLLENGRDEALDVKDLHPFINVIHCDVRLAMVSVFAQREA